MIVLKYSESYSGRGKKLGVGFYVLIACCLLIIGGASWFALSNYADNGTEPPVTSDNNSYREESSSYNEDVTDEPREPEMSESVAQSVENEPYSSEETVEERETENFTMPIQGDILKDYSAEQLQYSATYGDMRLHCGIDIACKNGTAVSACADGTVKSIENDAALGTVVTIEHSKGLILKYASLSDLKVKNGSKVKMGDIIGNVATVPAECNDKEHLHIEAFKDGKTVSPIEILGLN